MIAQYGLKPSSLVALLFLCLLTMAAGYASAAEVQHADDDEVPHPPAPYPESSFLDEATRAHLDKAKDRLKERADTQRLCPEPAKRDRIAMAGLRKCKAQARYQSSRYQRLRSLFPVTVTPQTIGGVYTEVFEPEKGVPPNNRARVLINLHGGGFLDGSRTASHQESIPIASVGGFKVVSVDYRMAPEYSFPAASDDAIAVYQELLKTYAAKNIGIYGCSAGGLLTAQVVAWLQKKKFPLPAAVGMFCSGGSYWTEGDSGVRSLNHTFTVNGGIVVGTAQENPYFKDVDPNEPLAFPVRSKEVMARFPPSLLISATRDLALSSVVHTHSVLVSQGVEAQLHVWEGLGHGFFSDPDLPASREMYEVTAKFFDQHLGRTPGAAQAAAFDANLRQTVSASVDRFLAEDKASASAPCQVLFVGSSSIAKWTTLAHDMAPLPVINRGFGGSHIEYVNRWFEEVVVPYHPRAIVFYAGESDVAGGKSVERVVADFDEFMRKKRAALGATPVYFISLKPSKFRAWQMSLQTQVNEAIRARAKTLRDLHYIDVAARMLDDGKPRDLYVEDGLHMSPQGYAIWTRAVRDALLAHPRAELQSCQRNSQHSSRAR